MRTFLNKVLIFVFLIFIILSSLGYYLDYRFSKDYTNKFNWMLSIENRSYDFAFTGSSRVFNMMDINTIEKRTSKKGINLGVGGGEYRLNYLTLFEFLKRNTIKTLFIQVDPFAIYSDSIYNTPNHDPNYIRFINDSTVFNVLNTRTSKIKLYLWYYLPIIKYIEFNRIYNFTHFLRSFQAGSIYDSSKGTSLVFKHTNNLPDIKKVSNQNIELQSEEVYYLSKLIDLAVSKNITTVLFTSPIFNYDKNFRPKYPDFDDFIKNLIRKKPVTYYDFHDFFTNSDFAYFYNLLHLNAEGTILFTQEFVKSVTI